jgi:DNA-binding NarL/FixJ family response regulator
MDNLHIFLADDHEILRMGLKRLIEGESDMTVIGEAGTGTEAIERMSALQPDVAVLDISMPELNGLDVTRHMRAHCPGIKILILTVHEDRSYSREVLESGASGYLLKRAAADELIKAIRQVAGGDIHVDPRISDDLIGSLFEPPPELPSAEVELSQRERTVLKFVAQGYSNKEIGGRLDLSVKTIET